MTVELWGTFSVKDHLVNRAFVADVLLYDQLVIPTKPKNEPDDEWPITWNLAKQNNFLQNLGDLAIAIPWDKDRRDKWQKRYDDPRIEERREARANVTSLVAGDVAISRDPQYKDLPYRITRELLQDFVNDDEDDKLFKKLKVTKRVRPGSVLEAVAAYPNFDAFNVDVPHANTTEFTKDSECLSPTNVFGWRFFIPDSTETSEYEDFKLLDAAMKLARKDEFVEMRGEFYKWWSDFAASGMSAEEGRADMEKRITEYQNMFKGQGWKTTARYGIKVADAFSGGLGLVNEFAGAGAEAFLGSADIFADKKLKREKAPARLKVAAIFHDSRARLGWKL